MARRKITNKSKIRRKQKLSMFSVHNDVHLTKIAYMGKWAIYYDSDTRAFQFSNYGAIPAPQSLLDAVKFWSENCENSIDLQDYLNMMFNAQDFID